MTRAGGKALFAAGSSSAAAKGQSGNVAFRGAAEAKVKPRGAGRRSSEFPRVRHEHYVEEPWVSARLFAAFTGGDRVSSNVAVLDPAAGFGHIVASARRAGYDAVGTDIVKRAPGMRGGRDFLSSNYRRPFPGRGLLIVSNPPFTEIRAFVEKALRLADVGVAMLVPTRRLNAAHWLEETPLANILYVSPRPSLWPGAIYRRRVAKGLSLGTGREDVCWLIFRIGGTYEGRAGWLKRDGEGA